MDCTPVMKKGASRAGKQSQKSQHRTRSIRGLDMSPAAAILPSPHSAKQEKKQARRIASTADAAQKSGSEAPSVSPDPEITQDAITRPILAAIDASKAAVMVSIEHLTTECTLIRHDLDKIRGRITEAEDRISVVEDTSQTQGNQLVELQAMVKSLQSRAEEAEDRQRRNNVRVVGLPEGAEGSQTAAFAELFFKRLLDLGELPPTYVVERAHRVPMGRRPPGEYPRPFLVRFLNYRDRDMILAASRKHDELKFENAKVMLFPDFSAETQRKRRSFNDVRKRLREKNIQYSMLYPSKLRVQHKGAVKFFDNPSDANEWLDRNP